MQVSFHFLLEEWKGRGNDEGRGLREKGQEEEVGRQ